MDTSGDFFEDSSSVEFLDSPAPSSPGPHTSTGTSPPESSDAADNELSAKMRRKFVPKKGHTKSRRGCHHCKRRKVKCQETLPECSNCKRLGLQCIYPGSAQASDGLSPSNSLSTSPSGFTMEDLRFFHHFLETAYPPLPMEGYEVWRGVAALSHNYDFLIHAMLGLAASHLNLYTGDCSSQALSHRVKAIKLLNGTLNNPCGSTAEGDARFGAIMALTFQASCMPEGMTEFFSMTRGCHVISRSGMLDFSNSLFRAFTAEGYTESVREILGLRGMTLDLDQQDLFDEFLASVRALAPLCSGPLEIEFLAATERVTKLIRETVVDAFAELPRLYTLITDSSNEDFSPLTDPHNYPAQILVIHFMLIEYTIGEISLGQAGSRFRFRRRAILSWLDRLLETLPEEYESYVEWPLKYASVLVAGLTSPFNIPNVCSALPRFFESSRSMDYLDE